LHKPKGTVRDFFQSEWKDHRILESATRDLTEFYAAVENTQTGVKFGVVTLIRFTRDDYYNFYYKDMDESMGPGYVRAGRKVMEALEGSEPTNDYAKTWREDCWKYIAKMEARPKVRRGDMVVFNNPITFTDGYKDDSFKFVRGSRFAGMRLWSQTYHITKWRERGYAVVPRPACSDCGTDSPFLSGIGRCPDCTGAWVNNYA